MIMKKLHSVCWFLVAGIALTALTSCLPLAAGAAAGYLVRDEGYKVQSPVRRSE